MRRLSLCLAAVCAGVLTLTACSKVAVSDESLTGTAADDCRALIDALPDRLDRLERRDVDGEFGAAYGDPPLVLRCGVADPGLSTAVIEVDGLDWEPVDATGGVALTLLDRCPVVELLVPEEYRSDNAWLVDLAPSVSAHTAAC